MDNNNPHILGTAPIGKLLVQYSLPSIIGMTLTSLYNIIDSIFIGHGVGPLAISGLAITFPLMNLLIAFCTLVGVGGATISSIRLGQRDRKGAEDILGNVVILCVVNAAFYGGVTFLFLDPILRFFGASAATLPYARDFMQVILLGTPVSYMMIGLNNVMRARAIRRRPCSRRCFPWGATLCLPRYLFSYLTGVSVARLSPRCCRSRWRWCGCCTISLTKKTYIRFHRSTLKLRKRIVKQIFSIGMSPFIMNVCACCIVIFINYQLLSHGDDYSVGAFGIINRVQMLFVMIVMGIAQGMQPITGYNFGAGLVDRARRSVQLGIAAGCTMTTLGFVLAVFFPGMLVGMFTDSALLVEQASKALSISMLSFPVVGAQIIICQFFQSIGKAFIAIFLSLSRQLLFLLPGLALLPVWMGVDGVWTSMPVSDFLATVAAVVMFVYQIRKFRRKAAVTTI